MTHADTIDHPRPAHRFPDMREAVDLLEPADRLRLFTLNRLATTARVGSVLVAFGRDDELVFSLNRGGMPTGYPTLDALADALRALGVDADPIAVEAMREREARIEAARARVRAAGDTLHCLDRVPGQLSFMVARGGGSWMTELADIDALEAWLDRIEQRASRAPAP